MDFKSEIHFYDDSAEYSIAEVAESDLLSILSGWGMPQMFTKLSCYGIDYEALQFMNESDIDKLFLPLEMGEKIKFRGKLKTWQRNIGMYSPENEFSNQVLENLSQLNTSLEVITKQNEELLSYFVKEEPTETTVPVATDVQPSPVTLTTRKPDLTFQKKMGQFKVASILEKYEFRIENGKFKSSDARERFIDEIIRTCFLNSVINSENDIKNITAEILRLLPNEEQASYYIKDSKGLRRGRLYNKYRNESKKKRQRKHSSGTPPPKMLKLSIPKDEKEYQKSYEALKCEESFPDLNLDDIKVHWMITQKVRIDEIKAPTSTDDLLENWPAYKSEYAPFLVSLDFRALYPDKKESLNERCYYLRWNMLRTKILPIFDEMIKDKFCRKDLHEFLAINHEKEKNKYYVFLVNLLHSIMPPNRFVRKEELNCDRWRFNIDESQNSFFMHCKTMDEFLEKKQQRETIYKQFRSITFQIAIVAIGENLNAADYYVMLDKMQFKFQTFQKAVNNAIQICNVLNIDYQIESYNVWRFLYCYIFDIQDRELPSKILSILSAI